MKVVIINAYVRENAGDAALLSVCLRQVREAFPAAEVVVAGMEDPALHPAFEKAPNIGSIRRYVADGTVSKLRRILRRAAGIPLGTAAVLLPRPLGRALLRLAPAEVRREAGAVSGADLVVSLGGGYMNARPGLDGYQNVFFVLLPALLAQRHGVPVVFAPQSFGPFPAPSQRRFVAHVLDRAALVLAREDVSVDVLTECGVTGGRAQRAVDSGFAFAPDSWTDWRDRLGVGDATRLVGFTARRWLAPEAQERYESALAATIDSVQATGARAVLIPQVSTDYLDDDDRIVERRVAARCATPPLLVDDRVDYRDIKGLYGECEMLVGTRFHSVIFALTSHVPCVAIEYEHKTRGIMRDLGLEEWVLPMADVTHDRLWPMVRRLSERRDDYLDALRRRLPGYVSQAERLPEQLRELFPTTAVGTTDHVKAAS